MPEYTTLTVTLTLTLTLTLTPTLTLKLTLTLINYNRDRRPWIPLCARRQPDQPRALHMHIPYPPLHRVGGAGRVGGGAVAGVRVEMQRGFCPWDA